MHIKTPSPYGRSASDAALVPLFVCSLRSAPLPCSTPNSGNGCVCLQVRARNVAAGRAVDTSMRRMKYDARKVEETATDNALTVGIGQGTASHTIK